jgi:hypothetical protein
VPERPGWTCLCKIDEEGGGVLSVSAHKKIACRNVGMLNKATAEEVYGSEASPKLKTSD